MICNIVDRRSNPYKWARVDVIIEPTWHDNACANADLAQRDERLPDFAGRKDVALAEAVVWAQNFAPALTLYIYDAGSDTVPDVPAELRDLSER